MAENEKKFVQAGILKPGSYVLIDEEVCQVKSTEKSKPRKHGAAKVRIVAFNIFTGQKRGLLKGTDVEVFIPVLLKKSAQFIAEVGSSVQIMDTTTFETIEAPKLEDVKLVAGDELEYYQYGGNAKIIRKR